MTDGSPTAEAVGQPRAAILVSTPTFEKFYERRIGVGLRDFLASYRNDWSWDYMRALREAGSSAILYVASLRHRGHFTTPDGFEVRLVPLRAAYRLWDPVRLVERSAPGRYVSQLVNVLCLVRPLRRALAQDGVQLLFVQEYWTARYDVLSGALDVPIVAVDQGVRQRGEVRFRKPVTFPRAAAILTQTQWEQERVARLGGRAQRVPNAVDSQHYVPEADGMRRSTPLVLAVARLHDEQKRLSDLIGALALLPDEWRLEIVGSGPDREALERRARMEQVADRVTFSGFVFDRSELRERYRSCTVFAMPSAYEGLPVALLEAMSCGAAVVGSEIPAIAEVVEHERSGLLVPVGDREALAGAILHAAGRRQELGAAARSVVESSYSQAILGRRLRGVVEASLAGSMRVAA